LLEANEPASTPTISHTCQVMPGAVLWKTGWSWVDPVTSLVVSAVVLLGTWGLLRDALHLALNGVPKNIELEKVQAFLRALPRVQEGERTRFES